MEICTLVVTSTENLQDTENIIGLMVAFSRETLRMDYVMAMVYGKEDLDNLINMKVFMQTIRSVGMVSSLGPVGMFTKATILMMSDMDLGKCTGVMEVVTKVTGKKEFNMEKVI